MESEILPRHQPDKEFQQKKRKKSKVESSSEDEETSKISVVLNTSDEIEWIKGFASSFDGEGRKEDDNRVLIVEHMEKQGKILEALQTQSVKQDVYNERLLLVVEALLKKQ